MYWLESSTILTIQCSIACCRRTLSLAIELAERAVEAQACYSLGNTYTLLRDFPIAIEYHQRHLAIAQELGDKVGEARACWSLGNAHSSIGNHEKALNFAQQHHSLAKDVSTNGGSASLRRIRAKCTE